MGRLILIVIFVFAYSSLHAADITLPDEKAKMWADEKPKLVALYQDAVHAIATKDIIGYGQCWVSMYQNRHDRIGLRYLTAAMGGKDKDIDELVKMDESNEFIVKYNEKMKKKLIRINKIIEHSYLAIQAKLPRPDADIKFLDLNIVGDVEKHGGVITFKAVECHIKVDEQEWILNLAAIWSYNGRPYFVGETEYYIIENEKFEFRKMPIIK